MNKKILTNEKFYIRLLSKPQDKIAKTSNEVESQAKTLSSVAIAFGQNLEAFYETNGVFIRNALA